MFFLVLIEKHIVVPPEYLGPGLEPFIHQRLNSLVGTCNIKYGYLINIFKIQSINEGVVNDSGDAIFTVSFQTLVYRPLRGEVIDGIVSGVERVGIEVKVGACKAFIPHTRIPNDIKYSDEGLAFKSDDDPTLVIKRDSIIRFKVENVSVKGQEGSSILSVIGTIAEDFLGLAN